VTWPFVGIVVLLVAFFVIHLQYVRRIRGPKTHQEAIALQEKLWPRLITRPAVAHHEAGHAVSEFYSHGQVQGVKLQVFDITQGAWAGVTSVNSIHRNLEYAAERQIAGDVAHYRYLGYKAPFPFERLWSRANPLFDSGKAWEVGRVALNIVAAPPNEWIDGFSVLDPKKSIDEQLNDWVLRRYDNVVRWMCRRDVWRAVSAVAEELQGPQSLPGREIVLLIEQSGLKPR